MNDPRNVDPDPKLDAFVAREWFSDFMHEALAAFESNVRYFTFEQIREIGTDLAGAKAELHDEIERVVEADGVNHKDPEQQDLVARELLARRYILILADELKRRRLATN